MSNIDQAVDDLSVSRSSPSTTVQAAKATENVDSSTPVDKPIRPKVPKVTLPMGFVRTLLYIIHENLHALKEESHLIFVTGPLRKAVLRIPVLHRLTVTNQEAIWLHWLYHKNILPYSILQQPRIQEIIRLQAKPRLESEFHAEIKKMQELHVHCPGGIAEARRNPCTNGHVVVTPEIMEQLLDLAIRMRKVDESMQRMEEKREKVRQEVLAIEKADISMALFDAWKDRPERFQRPRDTPRERLKERALEKSMRDEHPGSLERPATPTPSPKSLASNKENSAPFDPWAPHPTDSNPAPKCEHDLDVTVPKNILAQTQSCAAENVMSVDTSLANAADLSIPAGGNPEEGPVISPQPIPVVDNQPRSDHKRKHQDVGEGDQRPSKCQSSSPPPVDNQLRSRAHEETQKDIGKVCDSPSNKGQSSSSSAPVGDQLDGEHKRKRDEDAGEGDHRPSKNSRPSSAESQPNLKKLEACYTVPWTTSHKKWPVALRQLDGARARKQKHSLEKQPVTVLKMATNLQLCGQLPEAMSLPYMPRAHIWTPHRQMCWKWYCRVSGIPVVKEHKKGSSLRFEAF